MTEEKAFALTDPDGPLFLPGAFELALGSLAAVPRMEEAYRTGAGVGWHEHDEQVFHGCEQFFRSGLPRPPGGGVDPGPRRRPGQARAGRHAWPTSAVATGPARC